MTTYALYVIDHTTPMTVDEHNAKLREMPQHYFDRLKDVEAFCGGKLHRGISGYTGIQGNTEYVAIKIVI